MSNAAWLRRPNRNMSPAWRRDQRQQRIAEGRCARCGWSRGQDGTKTMCADCNAEQHAARRRAAGGEPLEEFCSRRLNHYIEELDRHLYNIYDQREFWSRRRLMHEGIMEIRK